MLSELGSNEMSSTKVNTSSKHKVCLEMPARRRSRWRRGTFYSLS